MLLPTLATLLVLLLQPVCLLYTRAVMWEAASETVRVAATSWDVASCRSYALRRLEAVPEVSIFHVGGSADWQVQVTGAGEAGVVEVSIQGHVRPLPLLGDVAMAFEERDGTGVVLSVSVSEEVRPEWVEGSYESWMDVWE